MNKTICRAAMLALIALAMPGAAMAYIGPGMGAGALAAVVGVLGSIVLAIFAVLWYPLKRMLKGRKAKPAAKSKTE